MKKVIIIGGVAGGASAAARLRRLTEDVEIVIFERGNYVSFANCGLPYYLSREIASIDNLLLSTPEKLMQRFNITVKILSEVIEILPTSKKIKILNHQNKQEYEEGYDELIISTGAHPFVPPIKGINGKGIFTVRTIDDIKNIDELISQNNAKNVCIAGGGFIGIEVAEQLQKRGLKVSILEAMNQILAPFDPEMAEYLHEEIRKNKIDLILNDPLTEIVQDINGNAVACVTKSGRELQTDLVILGIGVKPENKLAKEANLTIGITGGIKVNEYLQTSNPNIWAIGDCIEVADPVSGDPTLIALGGPANKQGRIVADNIMGANKEYKGTFGTFIIRVFSLTAAATGLNEKSLQKKKITDYEVIYLHPNSHASYYPGAERLNIKVIFSKSTRKILGAQIIGGEGTDKRMDVISTAMQASLDIDRLAYLELAYSPQYGSAKDPINLLGMIAENILNGQFKQAQWNELNNNEILLDVRSKEEVEKGKISNSLHIPLDSLRTRLNELNKDIEYIVYCQSGQRSYNATKILTNNGFKAKNLSGAYLTWKISNKANLL
jgi:NADPH-dependent 2,4-dienoyl-CoA reductase/sulfur reductase-like enzyme/rhodanese-related sulfurtransferase